MRSVLVCVRTTLAAQAITNAATQLGLADVITTAVSGADALARVAHAPADIVLVDTASVRPDTVGFTRRVLAQTPDAAVVFFGPEESTVARGAVEAGARGLIRGGDREDLVASVAKALMLLLRSRTVSPPGNGAAAVPTSPVGEAEDDASVALGGSGPQAVPLQRSEVGEEDGDDPDATDLSGDGLVAVPRPEANGAANGGTAAAPGSVGVSGPRRLALTERELQVLRGMADGKSNAEIGRELFVSEDTVKTHARRLFRKLGARDRAHAVAAAFRAGLVR